MGRGAVLLTLCLAGLGLPGCGDAASGADLPTLLEAEAGVRPSQRAAPTLVGREERLAPTAAPDAIDEGPSAHVDGNGTITIPAGATWGTVQWALHVSAGRRRAREHLEGTPPMLVDLPGVSGYVIVDGLPPKGATGLHLALWSSGRLEAEAFGDAWVAHHGCQVRLTWRSETRLLSTWQEALARLAELPTAAEPVIRVRGSPDLPASEVLRFLAAAARERAVVHVDTGHRRTFDDGVLRCSNWLSAHQAPSGCWDNGIAQALCHGRRMRCVPLRADPEQVGNAGLTGLSLLAFLGAGYTNRGKHPFARNVSLGLRHLKNLQRPDGAFPAPDGWDEATAHGFAALAMVEAYGRTGSPIFKGSAQRALAALAPLWSGADEELATPLTAAVLKSAAIINADARKRGKPEPLHVDAGLGDRLHGYARRFDVADGSAAAAGWLLTRIFAGEDPRKTADITTGALALARALEASGRRSDPAHLWLGTLVSFQVGKQPWKTMKTVLDKVLIEGQRKDGHVCCYRGSWDPPGGASLPGGRVAATALGAMCAQFFYRYDRVFGSR